MYRWEITQAALAQRVFAIVRAGSRDRATQAAETLLSAGFRSLEISLTTPSALQVVSTLRSRVDEQAIIGAGTVLDATAARMAIDAGACFLVSPSLDAEVIRTGHRYGIPVFPGVTTPTEIVRALELGADALKLFPATTYQPSWIKDVRAALPQAALLPTGGVTVANAPDWIAAGAAACGMGSALTRGGPDEIAGRAADLLARLATASAG